MIASLRKRWKTLGPATRIAVLAVLFGSLLPALLLPAVQGTDSNAKDSFKWLAGTAWVDSWEPIRLALAYYEGDRTRGLYEVTYFDADPQFLYSPVSLLLFEPFRALHGLGPEFIAGLNAFSWWVVLGIAMLTGLTFVRSVEIFQGGGRAAGGEWFERWVQFAVAVCATLLFYPIVKGYSLGQAQTWISLLFAGAVFAWLCGWRGLPGALIGLICLIKPQLVLLVVWAVIRREWRFVGGWAAVVVPLGLLSVWLYGFETHVDFARLLLFLSGRGESYFASHSVNSLMNRLLFNGPNLTWDPTHTQIAYNPIVHAVSTATSLALIGFALFWRVPGGQRARIVDLCIAGLSFTMASPIAYEHHYGVLLPIFAVTLPAMAGDPRTRRGEWAALAAAFVLSANYFSITKGLADTSLNVLQSYLLFAGATLLVLMYRVRERQGRPVAAPDRRPIRQAQAAAAGTGSFRAPAE